MRRRAHEGDGVKGLLVAGAVAIASMGATDADAQAILSSTVGTDTVYLGVRDLGHLNQQGGPAVNGGDPGPGATGIAYSGIPTADTVRDATSPGCLCEGWGVSATATGSAITASGFANVSSGTGGLTFGSFDTDDPGGVSASPPHGTFATSTVSITGFAALGGGVTVSQAYTVAVPGRLFQDAVTITNNTGEALTDVRYVRVMDWDVPFTEFSDIVSIVGTGTTTLLEFSNDQGFATADPHPLAGDPSEIVSGTTNVDFLDSGPEDHGAYFRFNFGSLLAGESATFSVFYGAAPTEALMLAALGAVDIELYSLGQSSPPSGDPALGTPITYAFGFAGVGGEPILPDGPDGPSVPNPGSLLLLGFGAAGLAWLRGRKAA
jgi:PEP-CTERM motif